MMNGIPTAEAGCDDDPDAAASAFYTHATEIRRDPAAANDKCGNGDPGINFFHVARPAKYHPC